MKKWLALILISTIIIVSGGYFFYHKNISVNILLSNRSTDIYFSKDNYLYLLDPLSNAKTINDIPKYQLATVGTIGNYALSNSNKYIYYDVNLAKDSQINKIFLDSKSVEVAFSSQTSGLENFVNFRKPIISPDNNYLAFIATNNDIDHIFIYNLVNGDLNNLSNSVYQGKIDDISWSAESKKIAFVDSSEINNSIQTLDLDKKIVTIYRSHDTGKITNLSYIAKQIMFLKNGNIYSFNTDNQSLISLTQTTYPNQITSYKLSPDNDTVLYSLSDQKTSNLYRIRLDSTNLFQLTNGDSGQGIFSKDGSLVAYFNKNDGIFVTNLNKTALTKIISISGTIDQLIIWR